MILALIACHADPVDTDTDGPASPAHGLAIATSDFAVGALATVDPVTRTVQDTLVATSGDTVVASDAGAVFQIDRSPPAAVRVWSPPDWSVPVTELALPGASNPQDAAVCGGRTFVTLLAEPRVAVFAEDGADAGSVDLSAYADEDGNVEAATLAHAGDRLFVALQRLDTRGAVWAPAGPGIVAEIECSTLTVARTWETGPNPSVHELSADALLVRTGVWGEADGALARLDVDGTLAAPFVTEATLGEDLGDVAVVGGYAVAVTAAYDFGHHTVRCFDLADGTETDGDIVPNYLSAVAAGGDGLAWIAQSVDYADADAVTGLRPVDPTTCAAALDAPLPTLLPPYALAAY